MKSSLLALVLVVLGAASAGAQDPATPPTPKRDTTAVPLDRIVAVVGDQVITQYDVQERMLAMQQSPGFRRPTTEAEFQKLAQELAMQVAAMRPTDVDELYAQAYIRDASKTVKDLVTAVAVSTGENVSIRRFQRFALGESLDSEE